MTQRAAPSPIALTLLLLLPLGACSSETTPPPKTAAKDSAAAANADAAAADAADPAIDDGGAAAEGPAPTAAGTPTDPAPAVADQPSVAEDAERMVATVETLGALHEKNAKDCPALAKAIEAFHGEHGDAMANSPPEVNAHIDGNEVLRARVRASMKKVMEASMSCSKDPVFMEMQKRVFHSKAQPPAVAPPEDAPEG